MRLDARAWARTGRPVVRQYREERPAGVAVVFDPRTSAATSGTAADDRFEAAVSRAAAACEAVGRNGGDLALFAAGREVHRFRGAGRAALDTALDALAVAAPVDPHDGDPFADPAFWSGLEVVAAVVLITADAAGGEGSTRGALIRRLGAGGRIVLSTPGAAG
ncbi:hypothetical protein LzC2_28060 [Planctomycetes bacterium LzC2]|uniref:DUF58 domain-containing protein n=1 Tax=Alienimonas chondri TaxID=2681879 RepID=A0ABX1VFR7_9PLAN|nr:hypothetical protein [Alienimonas chondri]